MEYNGVRKESRTAKQTGEREDERKELRERWRRLTRMIQYEHRATLCCRRKLRTRRFILSTCLYGETSRQCRSPS